MGHIKMSWPQRNTRNKPNIQLLKLWHTFCANVAKFSLKTTQFVALLFESVRPFGPVMCHIKPCKQVPSVVTVISSESKHIRYKDHYAGL